MMQAVIPPLTRAKYRWSALVLLFMLTPLAAQTLSGRVVKVLDGDTLEVLDHGQTTRVRLAHIDAPEKGQAYSQRAKQALATLCAGQLATVQQTDTDRYGRSVGEVQCQGQSANQTLVRDGLAWVYRKYTPSQHPYYVEERSAQAAQRGLWADPAPEPPWEWRRARRARSSNVG